MAGPQPISPFHLAIPVDDLSAAAHFYERHFECTRGREDSDWIDFNFFGHQLVLHRVQRGGRARSASNPVDGEDIPVPHFGVVLEWQEFDDLLIRLSSTEAAFLVAPTIRFAGQIGEQRTCFLQDPCGNVLEFKAFRDNKMLFARQASDDE
ncbi:MAG: glyoxalase [Luminiphilus sp.]|jgi:uncharacterized protein|nr:glyoxalase [Luminiphilus sp.]